MKNNIPSLYTVDNSGLYTKEVPYFANIHVFKADPIVIDKLKEQKQLLKNDKSLHGKKILAYISRKLSKSSINLDIDIDSKHDFRDAEKLVNKKVLSITKGKNNFKLLKN